MSAEAPGLRVVVAGAGFGGVWAARALSGSGAQVTVVDRNNYHTFFPLLYQVAAAELSPTDIAFPVRSLFRDRPDVRVLLADVEGLDLDAHRLATSAGPLEYDALVLALGSVPHFFGTPGAAEHAYPLRWMRDAIPLRHRIVERFEAADASTDPAAREAALSFVVVGGGPTGVEFSGALAELIHGPLLRDYPRIRPEEVSVVLVEAAGEVLGEMGAKLSAYARDRLRRRRVEVRTGSAVQEVRPGAVALAGGDVIAADTVVWTAGIQADPAVSAWGLPTAGGGRVPVTPELHLVDHPEVYVVGDLAWREEDGAPLPQVAQTAMQQGEHAAGNILAAAAGRPLRPFAYRDLGMMAVIGRNAAVARVFGRSLTGFTAWLMWLGIHLVKLIGARNRALVLVNWAWNYLNFGRAVRMLLVGTADRHDEA